MSTTTEAKITRAEAIRRFKAATAYTVVSRTFDGVDESESAGKQIAGERREIASVSTTGVRIVDGPNYPVTRFKKGDEWFTQGDLLGVRNFHRSGGEYLCIMYELEVPA